MRRSDREVTDVNDILSIMDKCDSCNLGLSLNDVPYVVPLNFGYTFEDGKLSLYLHSAREGKKLDIIAQNPNACFSMDCGHRLVRNDEACQYTMCFESVMGFGKIENLSSEDEKHKGLCAIMRHHVPDREFAFTGKDISFVCVFKLSVEEFTAKRLSK